VKRAWDDLNLAWHTGGIESLGVGEVLVVEQVQRPSPPPALAPPIATRFGSTAGNRASQVSAE
jgi:hypothetical protein